MDFSEVVILADPRFPGGTSTAVAAEIAALTQEGIVAGFCPVLSGVPAGWRDWHPKFIAAQAAGQIRTLDPCRPIACNIAVIHHPALFAKMPADPVAVRAGHVLLVLHHPPLDGTGKAAYDLAATVANIAQSFGADVTLAPVGPAVRAQLASVVPELTCLPFDWHNLVDPADWPMRTARPANAAIVIGRHSRPQPSKFPATLAQALQCYPTDPRFEVRMLGADRATLENRYGSVPPEWVLLPFDPTGAQAFLNGLDAYVYYHGPDWVEAFGLNVLEAILTGVPVVVPPSFEPLFGPAALYAQPCDAVAEVMALHGDADRHAAHTARARASVAERFGLHRHAQRLDRIMPRWRSRPPAATVQAGPPRRRVLMITSNGVGLGHLTRLLAIADRMGPETEVAFLTLSQAFRLAQERGYLTQFIPFHRLTGADPHVWNAALTEEVSDFIAFFRPDLAVFDGNVPYSGLLAALDRHPQVKRAWVRRALWPKGMEEGLDRAVAFDAVLQPGEVSARFDDGPVARHKADVFHTAPILLCRPQDRQSRAEARAVLGVDADATVVGLMLGAGTNYSLDEVRGALLAQLRARADVVVVELMSPIRPIRPDPPVSDTHRTFEAYPLFPISRAFDFMICSAGYNSFHEAILGGIPTVFVANEAPEMDRQILRATHARAAGWGEVLRRTGIVDSGRVMARMLDPDIRAEMRRRMARVTTEDGAAQAAGEDGAAQAAAFLGRLASALSTRRPGPR